MDSRIDKLVEDVGEIKILLAKQEVNLANNTESLKEHMARTKILENRSDGFRNSISFIKGALAVIAILGPVVAFLISSGILKKLI